MSKVSKRGNSKDREIKEAVKALSAAAKSLALASDALSRLYDTDEEDTSTTETDRNSVGQAVPTSSLEPHVSIAGYEDSDDEYMSLAREAISSAATAMGKAPEAPSSIGENKNAWSEMQNNLGSFEASKGDTESEAGRMANEALFSDNKFPPGPKYSDSSVSSSQLFFNNSGVDNLTISNLDRAPMPPKSWAHLLRPNGSINTVPANDSTIASDDPKSCTEVLFPNLKRRWVTPTGLQHKALQPLRAGSDILLLHSNSKSHVSAILAHCIQSMKRDRSSSSSIGVISVLIIVPQQTTGRLFLQHANELLSDFSLPHKAMLLPGGGSDVATEAERMSTERIDILISSPRVFINHVNSNSNLPNHLSRIRFVIYAGAHELTKSDVFLGFQFNLIKKRMQTRAKSPRQIIIVSSYINEHVQTLASRGLHPGYVSIHGTDSDDDLQSDSWDVLLK
ncbi:DEAD box helicase family, partial [Rhizoctonia solani]